MQKTFLLSLLALLPALGVAAEPGQYEVSTGDDPDTICLLTDGTWYGSTDPYWSGTWVDDEHVTYLTGSFGSGAANTVISFPEATSTKLRMQMHSTVVVWAVNDPPQVFPHAWAHYDSARCEMPVEGRQHGVLGQVRSTAR